MKRLEGLTIHDLEVGQTAEFTKTITEADVYGFAGITGDFNPVHVDQVAAEASRIGMKLPGPGCIYMSQSLRFNAPVHFGDTITARVEVTDINTRKNRITLATAGVNQDGDTVAEGESLVMPREP